MPKKFQKTIIKLIKTIAGSWWGVIFHTAWFSFWLISDFNLEILTLSVSLEAIFIGIFLLISSDQGEVARDKRELASQKRDTDIIEKILDLEAELHKQQQQILKLLIEVKEGKNIDEIKKEQNEKSGIQKLSRPSKNW